MIGGLSERLDPAQNTVGIESRFKDHLFEHERVNVMRTAKGSENAALFQELERTQMNFLVASESVRNGITVARERRGIENDQVVLGDDFFVRRRGGLGLQPIEN